MRVNMAYTLCARMEDDDWFEPQAQGSSSDPLVEQEYQRLLNRYSDAGYREGITDGKLSTLQQGFDESFAASVPPTRRLGKLRGRAAALLQLATSPASVGSSSTPVRDALIAELRGVVRELGSLRRADILPRDMEREAHEAEHGEEGDVLDVTDTREMEGLEAAMNSMGGSASRNGESVDDPSVIGLRRLDDLEARLCQMQNQLQQL